MVMFFIILLSSVIPYGQADESPLYYNKVWDRKLKKYKSLKVQCESGEVAIENIRTQKIRCLPKKYECELTRKAHTIANVNLLRFSVISSNGDIIPGQICFKGRLSTLVHYALKFCHDGVNFSKKENRFFDECKGALKDSGPKVQSFSKKFKILWSSKD